MQARETLSRAGGSVLETASPATGTSTRASRGLSAVVLALVALLALLAVASSASAGPDDLKGGSVVMQLQNARGLKLKPRSLTLPITGGAIDPVDGSGTAQVTGAFKAKRGKGKTKVKITTLTLGANGGRGSIVAKVGKDFVNGFGTLSGGTVTRDGYGARIENVNATIASKSAGGGVKAGQPLGRIVSMTTDPLDVQVVPGSPPGVQPIAPATTSGLLGTDYHFPVTGGSIVPDFSAGELFTGGGQLITKNSTALVTPSACTSSNPPTGSQLKSTDLSVAFDQNSLRAIATLPAGRRFPGHRSPTSTSRPVLARSTRAPTP